MGPNYEDELSPEQMAAIQRERNRALYDQAQMQQMGAAAAAQEAYPMAQHAEGVQQAPVGVPRPAAFHAPAGAGSPSPHGGAVADAHADAMQMGYGNDVQRQITSKPGEAPRRLITSKPEEAAAPQRQITSKPGEAPRRLITSK